MSRRALIVVLAATLAGCGAAARICPGARAGDRFASAIPLGAAVSWSHVKSSPGYARFFLDTYQWLTPENELKMISLQPEPDKFRFGAADALVNWALGHGKSVHGHVLIWDSQLPDWLTSMGTLDRATATKIMTTYIDTVLRHFHGRIGEWDVVNEALDAHGHFKHNLWYEALGPAYVADAFWIARAADPTVRLCYNDLGIEMPGPNADAVLRLVKALRRRRLIDCVGSEMHIKGVGPPARVLATELRAFARTGVDVHISELDDNLSDGTPLRAEAVTYGNVARACRSVPRCDRITTWGFTDASSWLGSSARALPFDTRCRPKPAWVALKAALARRS